jgi:hypothetical protein
MSLVRSSLRSAADLDGRLSAALAGIGAGMRDDGLPRASCLVRRRVPLPPGCRSSHDFDAVVQDIDDQQWRMV